MSFVVALRHSKVGCTGDNCDCKTQSIRTSIFTAALVGDLATIQRRVDVDVSGNLVKKTDGAGYTMLHLAAQGNHSKLVAYLLEQGADPDGGPSCECTPLHRASFAGSIQAVRLLVQAGADVNAIDETFGDRRTPLHKAAGQRHLDVYQFLMDSGSDPTIEDSQGRTALQLLHDERDYYCGDEVSRGDQNIVYHVNSNNDNNDNYVACQVIHSEKASDEDEAQEATQDDFGFSGKTCTACGKVSYMFSRVRGKLICIDCKSTIALFPRTWG